MGIVIVGIRCNNPVRQRQRGAPVCIVVGEANCARALCNLRQPVGTVERVTNLRLTRHLHRGAAAGVVIGVADAALRRRLAGEAVQSVIPAGDNSRDRIGRLRHSISRIVLVRNGTGVCVSLSAKSYEIQAIQVVVLIRGHLPLAVGERPERTVRAALEGKALVSRGRSSTTRGCRICKSGASG